MPTNMILPIPVALALVAAFNLLWIVVDGLCIRRGILDKAYPVPVIALAANTAWDVYGTLIHPSPMGQSYVNVIFLIADVMFLIFIIQFWQSDSPLMSRFAFNVYVAFSMVAGLILYLAVTIELGDYVGARMAFIDNFINSAAFIGMFYARPDLRGQSFYIALLKFIGTGCASIVFTFNRYPGTENSVLLPVLCIGIAILDFTYVMLVYRRAKSLGINPWRMA
jgi:hypothetical protein